MPDFDSPSALPLQPASFGAKSLYASTTEQHASATAALSFGVGSLSLKQQLPYDMASFSSALDTTSLAAGKSLTAAGQCHRPGPLIF